MRIGMRKRKQTTKAKELEVQKRKKSEIPEVVHFAHLTAVIKREKGLGSILIQGVEWPDEEEGDEASECPPLTIEELATLRHVVINTARKAKLMPADDIITDGQGDQGGSITWNTHTGNMATLGALDEVI
jgi:hypothetical protein